MKTETINQYTILYQYLVELKQPLYIFMIQAFQHIEPVTWWQDFVVPGLPKFPPFKGSKDNFKYMDIADLLHVLKKNWKRIFKYLDKDYCGDKYNDKFIVVNKLHKLRTIIAHANESAMDAFVFAESLAILLDFAKLIDAEEDLITKIECDLTKYTAALPNEKPVIKKDYETIKEAILSIIEKKVLINARKCGTLPLDIKTSVLRTWLRLKSMRTIDEIMGFFNNAIKSERGIAVENALHKHGLLGFGDIKDEVNQLYDTMIDLN